MRVLLLGKNGQVGWELQRSLTVLGELIALDRHSSPLCGDLSQPEALAETVRVLKPDIIVNAAAYTAVDSAESAPELAALVNAKAPAVLAREAEQLDALLVHYSTDYVFDGSGTEPWLESDQTGPLSVYGKTKLDGELAIQASGCRYLIFRTSWVYAARGHNFAKTMLRLATEREQLSIVSDQCGAPTSAELLADVTAQAIRSAYSEPLIREVFHCVARGETTWFDYASYVIEAARKAGVMLKVNDVLAVPTSEYPTPAQRPLNSRLSTLKLRQTFDLTLPTWQQGIDRMLEEVLGEKL